MKTPEFLPTRERYLPFKPAAMLDRMLDDPRLARQERDRFKMLAEMIAARFHVDFRRQAEHLKDLYEPFDPDRDTLPANPLPPDGADERRAELCKAFRRMLLDGNYAELPRRQIVECVDLQHFGGLKVEANLDDYKDLAIFYRGVRQTERCHRPWHRAWRKQTKTCTVFSRAALLVRTGEHEDRVYLKLFKDIVAEDLEMVLPRVRVRMRWIDGMKIGSGVAGSLLTAALKAFTTAVLSPALFLIMLGTFLVAIVRACFAYVTSKTRYLQLLSANLYFQNLANNSGVLTYLVDSAEAEEAKEMLLAYFLLYVERDREYTEEELGRRAGQWVRDEFGMEIDFEARDAVRKLIEKGLAKECRGVLTVYDLPSGLRRLDRAWDGMYPHNNGQPVEDDRTVRAVP